MKNRMGFAGFFSHHPNGGCLVFLNHPGRIILDRSERIDGDQHHSQVPWRFVRGYDKARLMGVAPSTFQVDPGSIVSKCLQPK